MKRMHVPNLAIGMATFALCILTAPLAYADQAGGAKYDTNQPWDGYRGVQNIRTNPNAVTGVAFVHPEQMDVGAKGGDFVAIGTVKGAKPPDVGPTNCSDNYNNPWKIYVDGRNFSTYFCDDYPAGGYYTAGSNPGWSISYDFCPAVSANRWLMSFDGTLWACQICLRPRDPACIRS